MGDPSSRAKTVRTKRRGFASSTMRFALPALASIEDRLGPIDLQAGAHFLLDALFHDSDVVRGTSQRNNLDQAICQRRVRSQILEKAYKAESIEVVVSILKVIRCIEIASEMHTLDGLDETEV